MPSLQERYADRIVGSLGCYDRVVLQGTLPKLCYAQGMGFILRDRGIRLFDYAKFADAPSSGWMSRCLKRLRVHGLIKRVGRTYKYYVTDLGRRVVLTGLKLKEMVVIPALAPTA